MSSKNIWIGIAAVVVVVAALVAYVHASKHQATVMQQTASSTPIVGQPSGNATVGATGQSAVITYTNSGFSPKTITIAEGTTVTWVNNSSGQMWVAGGPHPTHTAYDGTSESEHCVSGAPTSPQVFDECTAIPQGGSFSFTFAKVGTWQYHNHMHESDQGTVTVTATQATGAAVNLKTNVIPN